MAQLVFLLAEIYRLQAFIYNKEFLIDKTIYKSSQGSQEKHNLKLTLLFKAWKI